MPVTIKDVARRADVSPATVSRVINESSLVKEKTAARVKTAIAQLNYHLNDSARVLRTSTSSLIGVIGAGMDNSFLMKMLKGIECSAKASNFNLLYGDSEGELTQELNYIKIMSQKNVDGLIIITTQFSQQLLEKIKAGEIPTVFASGHLKGAEIPCVGVNNIEAAEEMLDYLYSLGHRQIGVIRGTAADHVTSGERIKGVQASMERNGLNFSQEMIYEGDFSYASGYQGAQHLLQARPQVTAIFCFDDKMAVGAIRGLESLGKKVPEDVSVVGFDDVELGRYIKPALTTIRQEGYDIGYQAMDILDNLIQGEPPGKNEMFIEHELIVRESSAPSRMD
ncbi:MAG: LacI family DNA-binding transcriptional regulator [Bacillota bacterium]